MSADITAEMIELEPVLIAAAQGLDGDPEEEEEGDRGEGDDEAPDEDELHGPVSRDAWHEQEVEEGGVPAHPFDDSFPKSLRNLSGVNGGES